MTNFQPFTEVFSAYQVKQQWDVMFCRTGMLYAIVLFM